MFANYLIYFYTLSEEQKMKHFFMMLIFFLILFAICGILKILKLKYLDDTKDSPFQRFLKKLWFYSCKKILINYLVYLPIIRQFHITKFLFLLKRFSRIYANYWIKLMIQVKQKTLAAFSFILPNFLLINRKYSIISSLN